MQLQKILFAVRLQKSGDRRSWGRKNK